MFSDNIILNKINKNNFYAIICGIDLLDAYFGVTEKVYTLYTNATQELLEDIFESSDCYLMARDNNLSILHKDDNTGIISSFKVIIREERYEEECMEHLLQQMSLNIEKIFFSARNGLIDLGGQWEKMINGEDYNIDIKGKEIPNEKILNIFDSLLLNDKVVISSDLISYLKSCSNFTVNPLSIGYELVKILNSGYPEKIISWEKVGIMQYVFPEFHYLFETEADTLRSGYDNLGLETIDIIKHCGNYKVCLATIFYQIGKIYSTISAAMNIKIYMEFEEKSRNTARRRLQYYLFDDEDIDSITKMISLCKEKIPPQYYELKGFIVDNFSNKKELVNFFAFRTIIAKLINPNKAPEGVRAVELILDQLIDDWTNIKTTYTDINNIHPVNVAQANKVIRDLKIVMIDNLDYDLEDDKQFTLYLIRYFLISEGFMDGDIDQIKEYIDIEPTNTKEETKINQELSAEEMDIQLLLAERAVIVDKLSAFDFERVKKVKLRKCELSDDDLEFITSYTLSLERLDEINAKLIGYNVFSKDDTAAILANQEARNKLIEEEQLFNKLNNIYIESDTSFFEEIFNFSKEKNF